VGRIVPSCNGDYKASGRFVLSKVETADGNIMNSADYRAARQVLVDPDSAGTTDVICAHCPARPKPQIGLDAVATYLADLPALAADDMVFLHDWSRHSPLVVFDAQLRPELEALRSSAAVLSAERDAYLLQRDQALGERDAYLEQRDIALGERNAYLEQRDVALGERNEMQRQREEATHCDDTRPLLR
jgi:hypothetical protein